MKVIPRYKFKPLICAFKGNIHNNSDRGRQGSKVCDQLSGSGDYNTVRYERIAINYSTFFLGLQTFQHLKGEHTFLALDHCCVKQK